MKACARALALSSFITTGKRTYRGLERVCELAYRSRVGDEGEIPFTPLFRSLASAAEGWLSLEACFEDRLEEGFEDCFDGDLCECFEDGFDSDFEAFEFLLVDFDRPDRLVGDDLEELLT